ncbi:MAG: right-handed parallel beta-helix repeat-containing protein [Gemmatimonadetes bacterium]|nr:right-handed parallel beta-helix repeat-containing protein [Gemmatimonadota bacterium]
MPSTALASIIVPMIDAAAAGVRARAGAALLLAACAGGDQPGPAGSVAVRMVDNQFAPRIIQVPPGGLVRFENIGRSPHNALAVDGSWSTEALLGRDEVQPGETVELRVPAAGRYPFYCSFHASPDGRRGMVGVLVVGEPAAGVLSVDAVRAAAVAEPTGVVRRVPGAYPSIQAAVDAAAPGDLVLISPGIYREQVTVTTPSLVIRGADRNRVILDGEFTRINGIEVLGADGVAVENLTVRNFQLNGVYWTGVRGYRASYVTAYNNGDYGINVYDSVDGVIEYSYASGSPDSGFYIGQCYPCRAVVNGVLAENNALGFSGTNAGGDLYLVSSVWRRNMGGIVPNSLDTELDPPQREITIAANLIVDNNNLGAPAKALQYPAHGSGVLIAGGVGNVVVGNVIRDHANHGVLVTPNLDAHLWLAAGNRIEGNLLDGSGRADLALAGPTGPGNCFSGNGFRTSAPVALQALRGCAGARLPLAGNLLTTSRLLAATAIARRGSYPHGEVASQPAPSPQPQMPGGAVAPVRPAVNVFATYAAVDVSRLSSIPLPAGGAAGETTMTDSRLEAPGFWELLFGFYGTLLPVVLLAAWIALAAWDLAGRDDLGRGARLGWVAAILLIPFLGAIAYHAFAARLPGWLRLAVVGGGIAAYLLITAAGLLLGGVI